jgi:hypothetical protein
MSASGFWHERVAELLAAARDGSLSTSERTELNDLLRADPAARRFAARFLLEEAALGEELRANEVAQLFRQESEALPFENAAADIAQPAVATARWWKWGALAAALALIAGAAAWSTWFRSNEGVLVAKISNASGAQLSLGRREISPLRATPLHVGRYELTSGLLEITWMNGAVMILESPAVFALTASNVLELGEGSLSATVPPTAIGFTVQTPDARIVDLGTEFSISADAEASEVHVFKGEVLVTAAGETDPQRLTESQASRIDAATGTLAGITCEPDRFFRTLTEPSELYSVALRRLQPVAYYRMRTMTDGASLKDVTRGSHDGKVVPGRSRKSWAPGKFGSSLRFGGAEAGTHAIVADFPRATSNTLSVCAWVLAESRPRWASIAKHWAEDGATNRTGQFHFGLWQGEGGLEVQVRDAQGRAVGVHENVPLPLSEWQFVAFTLDGATLRLYRNGVEVAAAPCAGLAASAPPALGIGVKLEATGRGPERGSPGFWSGRIDELAVFHRALTPAQIRKLHETAALPPPESP